MLEELCDMVKNTSLCGLGQSAPNPVLSTLRYFPHEYQAHVEEKKCPAGVCAQAGERRGSMSPAANVKTTSSSAGVNTLTMDGRDISAPSTRPSSRWRAKTTCTFPRSAN